MISREKLAWMAGILDMKGTIIRKNNQQRATPQLVLMVETTRVSVVAEMGRLTGSNAEARPDTMPAEWLQRGCTEHCPEAHIEHTGRVGVTPLVARWTVTGAAAAIILHSLIPYMQTDRGMQAMLDEALTNVNLRGRSGNSARQAVARLARLGWPLPPKIARQRRELAA